MPPAVAPPPLLAVHRLVVSHDEIVALKEVSLSVEAGEIVALLGANGAGKTTLLRTISGLLTPLAGSLRFAGEDIAGRSPGDIAALGIAHVPEGRRLFPGLSARDNILLGAVSRRSITRRVRADDLAAMLRLFPEIAEFAAAQAWALSGGQQQMVALARGLMARPRLLLLDEPSLGLAPIVVRRVYAAIAAIRAEGTAVLLVEQNATLALGIADRGYVLAAGRLAVEGPSAALQQNDAVRAAYLGPSAPGPPALGPSAPTREA